MEQLLRNAFLFMARSRSANDLAKRYGLRFGAQRFVAGQTMAEAAETVRTLNQLGLVVTLDHLGESVSSAAEAIQSAQDCMDTLKSIANYGLNSNLSLKLTQLGIDISQDLCEQNMHKILETANSFGNFVRIDMEDYAHNQKTIDLFMKLHQKYPKNVGLVIQAYLYKSKNDLKHLGLIDANLRIVKGAYKEPPSVAYPEKADVDSNFIDLLKTHLQGGHYTAIATHDEAIIHHMKTFIHEKNIPKKQFEFQMLYGIRTQLQQQLANEGYKVRIYVPYGNDWYAYFMRRLAERPANVGFVVKSMVKK